MRERERERERETERDRERQRETERDREREEEEKEEEEEDAGPKKQTVRTVKPSDSLQAKQTPWPHPYWALLAVVVDACVVVVCRLLNVPATS